MRNRTILFTLLKPLFIFTGLILIGYGSVLSLQAAKPEHASEGDGKTAAAPIDKNNGSGSRATQETQAKPSIESTFLANRVQVTRGYKKAGEGYFSPDGKNIIFQAISEGYPFYQIYTRALNGTAEEMKAKRVSTGRGRTTCSYFWPKGKSKRVIFASSHQDPDLAKTEAAAIRQQEEDRKSGHKRRYSWVFDQHMDIYEGTTDGKITRQLTKTKGYDAECAYSPDGKHIVFCSDRDGDADLYIMDADGSNVRQLTNEPGYDGGPFFSPDGKWIIYRTDRLKREYLQIHAISFDGKIDVALTKNIGVNWAPYWHPTKPYIIWCGADHTKPGRPNYDLWMLRYKAGEKTFERDGPIVRITDNPMADVLPVFSPDGKKLMWTSNRTKDHTSQLYIADFNLPAVEAAFDSANNTSEKASTKKGAE